MLFSGAASGKSFCLNCWTLNGVKDYIVVRFFKKNGPVPIFVSGKCETSAHGVTEQGEIGTYLNYI